MTRPVVNFTQPIEYYEPPTRKTYYPIRGWKTLEEIQTFWGNKIELFHPHFNPELIDFKVITNLDDLTPEEKKKLNNLRVLVDYYNNNYPKKTFQYDLNTKKFQFNFPSAFIQSKHQKYVVFQYCRATCDGYIDGETEIHCDFIPRDDFCDGLIWYANVVPPDDNRKYEMINTKTHFHIWFTNAIGQVICPDNFVLFLKLIY